MNEAIANIRIGASLKSSDYYWPEPKPKPKSRPSKYLYGSFKGPLHPDLARNN